MQAWRRLRTQVISHHNLSHQQKMEFMIGLLAIHVTSKFRTTPASISSRPAKDLYTCKVCTQQYHSLLYLSMSATWILHTDGISAISLYTHTDT